MATPKSISKIPFQWLRTSSVLICLLLMAACSESNVEPVEQLRTVRSVVVGDTDIARLSTYSGVSKSARESRLSFKVPGTIQAIPVKVGDQVAAGATIARIESSTYELQLQQAQAALAQATAAARNAATVYERTKSLYASNNASLGDLDAARAGAESTQAQMRSATKSAELAKLNLSYTTLSVDVDCLVDAIAVEVNENVSTASEVARVNCSDDIEVEVTVPEGIVTGIKKDDSVQIKFDAIPNTLFKGRIVEIGVGGAGVGATFPVTVAIDENHPLLRPGLAASIGFSLQGEHAGTNDLVIPVSALVKRTEGTFVYVVNPSRADESVANVIARKVEAGALTSEGVIIKQGLSPQERVVTAGVSFLRDGMQVKLQ